MTRSKHWTVILEDSSSLRKSDRENQTTTLDIIKNESLVTRRRQYCWSPTCAVEDEGLEKLVGVFIVSDAIGLGFE